MKEVKLGVNVKEDVIVNNCILGKNINILYSKNMDVLISLLITLVIFIGLIGISFHFFPKSNVAFLVALIVSAIVVGIVFK
jgi:hypothetical protein